VPKAGRGRATSGHSPSSRGFFPSTCAGVLNYQIAGLLRHPERASRDLGGWGGGRIRVLQPPRPSTHARDTDAGQERCGLPANPPPPAPVNGHEGIRTSSLSASSHLGRCCRGRRTFAECGSTFRPADVEGHHPVRKISVPRQSHLSERACAKSTARRSRSASRVQTISRRRTSARSRSRSRRDRRRRPARRGRGTVWRGEEIVTGRRVDVRRAVIGPDRGHVDMAILTMLRTWSDR